MADLDHPVTYVAQSRPMSCWAASAAMMTNSTEAEILQQFAEFGDDGADEPECRTLAERLQMNILPEACRNADGWWQILGRGPVMVGIPGHFIVVSGIYTDDDGNSQVHVYDPARGDYWSILETVENGYEADWEFSYDLLQR
jgi:ABC-type bacteriocin/lantibiotic exporter with double-glycine peptidase domain